MFFGISFEPRCVIKEKKQANIYYRFLQVLHCVKMVKVASFSLEELTAFEMSVIFTILHYAVLQISQV